MELFLVYSANNSWLSKIIKYYTKEHYNHVSLSLTKDLNTTYSFGRKELSNPFIGGFVQEDFWNPFFLNSDCSIYSITITPEQYNQLEQRLHHFHHNQHAYRYNFLGLLALSMDVDFERRHAYFCSEFVATLLQESRIIPTDKKAQFVKPLDLINDQPFQHIFEGKMVDYLTQETYVNTSMSYN